MSPEIFDISGSAEGCLGTTSSDVSEVQPEDMQGNV